MKDINCPSCGKTFRIDPSSFEEILHQIRDEEFNKQIKERLLLAQEDNNKAFEILKREQQIKFIEQKTEIEVLAIGIGHDVSRYYNRAIKITDVNELGDVMISQLSTLFDTKKKPH